MEPDAELIARAKAGDDAAFEALVRRYVPQVYAFLARYMGDAAAAEDAAQETFVKVWKGLKKFDGARPLGPWLFQIARNAANDALRKKRALPFSSLALPGDEDAVPFADTLVDDAPLPPELFLRRELGEAVARALTRLPERDRAVLLLRYEEELSFDDIAEAMKAPMNTVKSWHRRALARLRGILIEDAPETHLGA